MRWLTDNWNTLLPKPWPPVALVLMAVVCGVLVGAERQRKQKAVGFRTLSLVSLGSAVFTMISAAFGQGGGGESLRIAPQVVSGIGFLGAGVILRGPFGITGLTSAATIWAMAAVGMVVGVGYAGAGLALTVFMLVSLGLVSLFEERYVGRCQYVWMVVAFRPDGGKTLVKIEEVLDEYRVAPRDRELQSATGSDDPHGLRLRYCNVHRHHREFLARLADMPEILGIRHAEEIPKE